MVILSTDDLDASIAFYSETLGMGLTFRDGAHERRAVVYNKGNGIVFYKPLA